MIRMCMVVLMDEEHYLQTHNVYTPEQAIDIISVFQKWVDVGHSILTSGEYEQ